MQQQLALSSAKRTIEQSLGVPVVQTPAADRAIDCCFRVGETTFAVEVKSNARGATVSQAVAGLRAFRDVHHETALLLVVPHMGETGAEICERFGVNWVDLHGNASIHENKMHVFVRGCRKSETNGELLHSQTGVNPFSRKAARVVHTLLTNPKRNWTRLELEQIAGLDKGYISKIVSELSKANYIQESSHGGRGEIYVVEPMVLLDAWSERYRKVAPAAWGLVAARDGFESAHKVTEMFKSAEMEFALTGLAAAAEYSRFGSFRRVDVYVANALPEHVEAMLHAGDNQRGRNVAVYLDAPSASLGAVERRDLRLASPVLTYLDLAQLPERSNEARDEMRRYLEQQWA